ncbi:hypothetical protein [Pontibacter pudoricolor]|uniref:hypothetical protein n=1 Tax=Pontibacter pudoricolor TaxID=2694930 RepID=UPI00139172DB|nr:hypothetical protein [Pontibacter pudoricolor]
MVALNFYLSLVRREGLQEWEKLYLTPKPELPDHNVDLANKIASYSGYDEYGNPAIIQFSLIAMMKQKVVEEQKKTLSIIDVKLNTSTRSEGREYLLDILVLVEQLRNDATESKSFDSYPSIIKSLDFIERELRTSYTRLLSNLSETTSQIDITAPAKRIKPALPQTFTYIGFSQLSESEATSRLFTFAHELIKAGLVSKTPFDKQQENVKSVADSLVKIFLGKALKSPIIWKASNGKLRYLIHQLQFQELIEQVPNQGHWDIAISCFKMKDGSSFSNNQLRLGKDPERTDIIDQGSVI